MTKKKVDGAVDEASDEVAAKPKKKPAPKKASAKKPAKPKKPAKKKDDAADEPMIEAAAESDVIDAEIVAETPIGDEPVDAAPPPDTLTDEERELSAIYGEETSGAPAKAHAEFQDRQTRDEDRPMMPEINAREERKAQWQDRRDRRKQRRDDRQQRRDDRGPGQHSQGQGAQGQGGQQQPPRRDQPPGARPMGPRMDQPPRPDARPDLRMQAPVNGVDEGPTSRVGDRKSVV